MSYAPTIQVFPIQQPLQLEALKAAAEADNHQVLHPSHLVLKNGEIVGYLTVGWCVNWWMHSAKCDRNDSQYLMCALETIQAQLGLKQYVVMCSAESPYAKAMDKFGTRRLGETTLYLREM